MMRLLLAFIICTGGIITESSNHEVNAFCIVPEISQRQGGPTFYHVANSKVTPTRIRATSDSNKPTAIPCPEILDLKRLRHILEHDISDEMMNSMDCTFADNIMDTDSVQQHKLKILLHRWTDLLSPYLHDATGIGPSTIASAGTGLFAAREFSEGEIITCYPGDGLLYHSSDDELDAAEEDLASVQDEQDEDELFIEDKDLFEDEEISTLVWAPSAGIDEDAELSSVFEIEDYTLAVCDSYSIIGVTAQDHKQYDPCYAGHFANDGACLDGGDESLSLYVLESNDVANAMHISVDGCHMATVALRDVRIGEEILVTYGPEYWTNFNQRNGIISSSRSPQDADYPEYDFEQFEDEDDGDEGYDDLPSDTTTSKTTGKGFG